MISKHIFTTLRDSVTGLDAGAGKYHIYPKKVPDAVTFDKAVVYNKISSTPTYSQLGVRVQLTCVAKTYLGAEELSHEIATVFRNKQYGGGADDVLYTSVLDITDLPQDEESDYYLVAITIYIKTRQAIG